ncbi:MAG: trimeric intracellular cation channel family protein [Fibromonadaceae bacterium]|nr:trimeric intracellular cation channel family protein [Fibromonadaceae bacterium]
MILLSLDLLGTFAFAITGAVKAANRDLDWFGAVALALATGVCGGIMRDALIGNHPPIALQKPMYAIVCIAAAMLVIVAQKKIVSHWLFVQIADAIGLGTFTAIGAIHAENAGTGGVAVVSLAVLTAIGGGMLRDILAGEVPQVLKSDFYATVALIGGLFFWFFGLCTSEFHGTKVALTIAITIALRLYAIYAKLELPKMKKT